MASINTRKVVLGGVLAGLIINISEYILNEPVLGAEVAQIMAAHNLPQMGGAAIALFLIFGFALGLVLVWLYAAIRPRFGPGPKTAAIAGVAVWFLAYVTSTLNLGAIGLLPLRLLFIGLVWGLIELLAAALVGGWLYSEP